MKKKLSWPKSKAFLLFLFVLAIIFGFVSQKDNLIGRWSILNPDARQAANIWISKKTAPIALPCQTDRLEKMEVIF